MCNESVLFTDYCVDGHASTSVIRNNLWLHINVGGNYKMYIENVVCGGSDEIMVIIEIY
jgi:hypothetical protein